MSEVHSDDAVLRAQKNLRRIFHVLFHSKPQTEPEYRHCSCSAWNTARSSFQQYDQLKLYSSELTDEFIMMDILVNHGHPCKACTNVRIAETYIPTNHQFTCDLSAINGWIFQNHFDCVASAIVGGINGVFGFTRGQSLFTTKDIIHAMDIFHRKRATDTLKKIISSHPKENWADIKSVITKVISGAFVEENSESVDNMSQFYQLVDSELMMVTSRDIITNSLLRELYMLANLRVLNVCTSFQSPSDFIPRLGLGIKVKSMTQYTYEDLQQYLQREGTSILVDLPQHLGMIFAVGRDKDTKKYPHVLLSRPSGGQSPCGWVPWRLKDRFPGEILWEDDIIPDPAEVQEAVRTGKLSEAALLKLVNSDSGIAMELYPHNLRRIYILTTTENIVKNPKPMEYDECFTDIAPVKCETCCNDSEKGDSLLHFRKWECIL